VYFTIASRFRAALAAFIEQSYGVALEAVLERPPRLEMGELSTPVAFELARRLKRAPRQIAQDIAAKLPSIEGISRVEVAGAGYVNAFFDRARFWQGAMEESSRPVAAAPPSAAKVIVEHTNINPNKAAHIGHLRNAVLGDTFVRLLRQTGNRVEVQNYIDNTGVQVADVVVGFLHMEKKSVEDVRRLAANSRFDYYCWDLYARVTHFFEEDNARLSLRADVLKAIEEDRGDAAAIGHIVADAIVACHLCTMARLGVTYDLLPRESEILHLKFWDAAFEKLKATGAIQLATAGKNAGCWVMPWSEGGAEESEEGQDESQAKIIVRSNGTVTYVGKDIAYQLWKFGLLGRDFHYTRFAAAPPGHAVWVTTSGAGDPQAPQFGGAARVYNVIDTRQSYLQRVVIAGLRALGYNEQADRSVHFAYEIVALSPRCAREMGYELSPEEAKKPYVEVSGRKGLGVKADDLLDKLEEAALAEVSSRHPDMSPGERNATAHAIAIGALRYFLLKYTRTAIIAFDFKDALSFEGETGPYCQYAVVRIRGIRRKGAEAAAAASHRDAARSVSAQRVASLLTEPATADLWDVVVLAGSLDYAINAAIGTQEPAFIAKYAFQLAQAFNLFYHKHHILSEADAEKKAFLLALTELVEAQLTRALDLMGVEAPEKM
jgi:arginyl-tRNA synthetase